ncbi:MAG: PilZ domain-containing protein [Pseudomonadota bacterium]|nr:PilZ domain-containing protein [Pseudomonadota bacterium]
MTKLKAPSFDEKLLYSYPRSNQRMPVRVGQYSLKMHKPVSGYTTHISPHGIEFISEANLERGSLLRIDVVMPDYWQRKHQLVDYQRVDQPDSFAIFVRVVRSETTSAYACKKILAQTVNIDEVDQEILVSYLHDELPS